ncbi:YraN family protein [Paenibacillus sp. N3/727]|uniref:YraN family protein n=1 Tax=Paenibacillus sp. N3/727 TaxID=2925845 RepID=UPI001F5383FD|nr:YraN family protein [Paenibacillus sp. N3/727]UNK16724.1 YraN family protein [Paenibacillus sp. N3/727]
MKPMSEGRKDSRKQKGAAAEEAAASFLVERGLSILDRNWRSRMGEIDIIANDRGTLVFVEVRSRSGTSTYGTPSESVNHRKIAQVRSIAQQYIHYKKSYDIPIRFDVVAVILKPDMSVDSIELIEAAF